MLFQRSWLDKFCKFFKYLLTEFCDSLLSWPCVNLGRLSHQKTFNKNTFCLLDIAVDTFFCDSILPLVYSIRSPDDCIQYLIKTYELEVFFICFLFKKIIKKIYIINNRVFNFLFPNFPVLLGSSTSYCHIQTLVQRHKVLRRPPSVGMPRHALRRRMPKIAPSAVTTAVAARCGGVTPTFFLEDSGRVLNPILVPPAIVKNPYLLNPISGTNHAPSLIFWPPLTF